MQYLVGMKNYYYGRNRKDKFIEIRSATIVSMRGNCIFCSRAKQKAFHNKVDKIRDLFQKYIANLMFHLSSQKTIPEMLLAIVIKYPLKGFRNFLTK